MSDYPQYPTGPSSYGGGQPTPTRGPRPAPVELAVKLIWVSIALSLVSAVVTFLSVDSIVRDALHDAGASETVDQDVVRAGVIAGGVFGLVIGVALVAVLAVFIAKGANWARITYTVLTGLGIAFTLLGFLTGGASSQPVLLTLLSLVGLALSVVVLVLLWRPESNGWFRTPRFPVA